MSSLKMRFSGLVAASTMVLGACATTGAAPEAPIDLATDEQRVAAERSDPLTRARFWAGEYQKEPENIETATYFAKALRSIESHDRVVEVASNTLILYPADYEMLMLLGRSYLSLQKYEQAGRAFGRAISADNTRPDAFASLGLTYDRLAQHDYAQRAYRKALEIDPKRTTTLTNYGLSLALSGDIASAEDILRKASALPDANTQVRQNLALVLGLQGKFNEMKTADALAPKQVVEDNAKLLKQMIGEKEPAISAALSSSAPAIPAEQKTEPVEKVEAVPTTPIVTASLTEIGAPASISTQSVRPAPKSVTKTVQKQVTPKTTTVPAAVTPGEPKNIAPATARKTEAILATAPKATKKPAVETQTARLPGGLRGSLQD